MARGTRKPGAAPSIGTLKMGVGNCLVAERAEDDPEAAARLVEIVEQAFELNQEQRQFLAQMTTVAPGVADEPPSLTAH